MITGTTPTNNTEQRLVKNFIDYAYKQQYRDLNIKCKTWQPDNTHTLSNMPTKSQPQRQHNIARFIMKTTPTITSDIKDKT